jgi:hypothetical protein
MIGRVVHLQDTLEHASKNANHGQTPFVELLKLKSLGLSALYIEAPANKKGLIL